jgi:hypothetical protein
MQRKIGHHLGVLIDDRAADHIKRLRTACSQRLLRRPHSLGPAYFRRVTKLQQ